MPAAHFFSARKLVRDEAVRRSGRLRAIYRDAVVVAGPRHYTASQVAAWASSADDVDRWTTRLEKGATWVAAPVDAPDWVVGEASMWPADHVDLLYVDPAFHRRGIGRMLLAAVEPDARRAGIGVLTADCSLHSHPVFAACGYTVVAWEESAHRGEVFRRARMRKVLA